MTIKYEDYATANQAVLVIFKKDNKVAFMLRQNTGWMDGHYGLPGGRVDNGESYTAAAIREVKEEVGITLQPADLKPVLTLQRHSDDSDWVDIAFEVTNWEGELTNAEPDVHAEITWLAIDDLPHNMVPSMREVFSYLDGKAYIEYGWDETNN